VPRLVLLNGPPGVGKSTVARRYLDDHPLALLIEIDDLRVAMGGWADHEGSRLHARTLALALARTHLGAGLDVVVPQYLGRPAYVDQLQAAASEVGAAFEHVLLVDDRRAIGERFRDRRADLLARGGAHPQADLADDEIDAAIADAERLLAGMVTERGDIVVVRLSAGDPYEAMLASLG
jgi:predicted kinase